MATEDIEDLEDLNDELSSADADDDTPDEEDFEDEPRAKAKPEPDDDEDEDGEEPVAAAPVMQQDDPVAKAKEVASQWEAEQADANRALADAEAAWKKTEADFDADNATHDDRLKAQQAMIDARVRVTRATEETGRAKAYATDVEHNQPPPAARDWSARNPRYATDAKFKADANTAYQALITAGYDPKSPAFYTQLDRKLRSTPRMSGKQTASGAPVVRSGGRTDGNANTLTDKDKNWMRSFGLNPGSKQHQQAWTNNKRALAEKSRASGRGR